MARNTRLHQGPSWLLMGLLAIAMLFLILISGLMAALVPVGTLARLLALPIALAGLILLWILPKRRQVPENLMNLLLFALIALINLWPAYLVYRFGGMPSINPTKLAWLALFGFAGFNILSGKEPMARLIARCKAHPILIGTILFLFAWRIISALTGKEPISQVLGLAADIISCYMLFFIVLAVLRDERDVFRLIAVLVAVAVIQALLASYESVVKHTLFERFVSVSSEDSAVMLDTLREKFRGGHYRAQGTFEHPMVLAEFMAMMIPLALTVFLSRHSRTILRWISLAFIPLALGVIVISRSRVGIAVLLGSILLIGGMMMLPRGKRMAGDRSSLSLILSLFMVPLLVIAGFFVMQELSSLISGRSAGEANSTMTRVLMLERGIPLLRASPFFGYGNGMGAVKLGFFDGVRFNIDNYWLSIALDAGLPGLLSFVGGFIGAALLGLRCYKQRDDRAGLAAGFMAVSLVIMLACKTVLSISSGLTLAYVMVAAIIVLSERGSAVAAEDSHKLLGAL